MSNISDGDLQKLAEKVKQLSERTSLADTGDLSTEIARLKFKVENGLLKKLPRDMKPGDIVRWKSGLKNKKYPKEGQPAYVIEFLKDAPIIQENKDSGSPYYREPLDLQLALLDDDGDLVIFHYDHRRFEIVP